MKGFGTLKPLETEEEGGLTSKSDHKIAYFKAALERRASYKWEQYTYRQFNDDSIKLFRDWVVMYDWEEVLTAATSDEKAEVYQAAVVGAESRDSSH